MTYTYNTLSYSALRLSIIFFSICLFILQACRSDKSTEVKTIDKPDFHEVENLFAKTVKIDDVYIEAVNWKFTKNKLIVLSPKNRDNFLYFFSLPDMQVTYKYGQYGQGPSEFIAVNWVNTIDEKQVGIYDIPKLKMYLYSIANDTMELKKTFNFRSWDQNLCKPYTAIQQLNDSIYLLKAYLKEVTEIDVVNINNDEVLQVFNNMLKRKPNLHNGYTYEFHIAAGKNVITFAYNYIDRIEMFEYKDNQVHPFLIIGSDKDQSDVEEYDDYRKYYTDVFNDGSHIYALYQQGQIESQAKNSVIEIYTLDGTPVKKLVLDVYITKFAIDHDRKCIYGANWNMDFDFMYKFEYDLQL